MSSFTPPPIKSTISTDNIQQIQNTLPIDLLNANYARMTTMREEVKKRMKELLPRGIITIWNGRLPPPRGWALCDGTNGTPDLRGKFIVGAGINNDGTDDTLYPAGSSGGKDHKDYVNNDILIRLTKDNLPPHKHPIKGFISYKTNENANLHYGYVDGTRRYGEFELSGNINKLNMRFGNVLRGIIKPRNPPTSNDTTEAAYVDGDTISFEPIVNNMVRNSITTTTDTKPGDIPTKTTDDYVNDPIKITKAPYIVQAYIMYLGIDN